MGPLDGTLGDVPCVHLSRCTKRSGMFSIHGKMSNPGDGSVGLVRGVAERRWPPSFSPTELLWKTTGSCLMMLGAGSGIGCLLGVFLGVAVCCQLSGTRACWARPPVSGPLAPAGNRPVPPFQGPRHLWLGTEAPPLCQLCGCSDPSAGVVHAGPAVPILVPPRMAATWPVPPCVRALGTCRRGLMCLLGAFAPPLAPSGLIRALGT